MNTGTKMCISVATVIISVPMNYQMEDLTLDDIRRASSNYLRSCLKEDIAPELSDMIDKELYIREERCAI